MTNTWDEPQTAISPRGWCYSSRNTSPVGFYLQYDRAGYGHEDNERILASAYWFFTGTDGMHHEVTIGNDWFATIADAKAFVESKVACYLDSAHAAVA